MPRHCIDAFSRPPLKHIVYSLSDEYTHTSLHLNVYASPPFIHSSHLRWSCILPINISRTTLRFSACAQLMGVNCTTFSDRLFIDVKGLNGNLMFPMHMGQYENSKIPSEAYRNINVLSKKNGRHKRSNIMNAPNRTK